MQQIQTRSIVSLSPAINIPTEASETTAQSVAVNDIQVIRRDGSTTPLNITKIRSVVEWATQDKDINPIELEAGLTTRLRNGVTTREIQDNLIDCALGMCSPNEPEWRYVAGRLHIWSLWKDVLVSRGYGYGNYAETVNLQVENHRYDRAILQYSPEELTVAGSWIRPEWDKDYDYAGAVLLTKRYLLADELPQEAFLTCALLLAEVEVPHNRLAVAKRFYEAIAQRKISLATPILANLRVPNGSLSSCFIIAMDDNLESIFSEITNTARISKNGGGVGVNVSRIRATGSWVMGKEKASGGIVPWIKLLNDTAIAVNQGGRRAGAVTVGLDVWHLDVPEFLEMQTENGDQRRKAYDVFPQLVISDEFMRRVETKQEWTLVDPYEVKANLGIDLAELWGTEFEQAYSQIETELDQKITLYKKVNARELFKEIMRSQVETGMPYLAFKDTINEANPNKHEGYIPGVNLCVAPETLVLTDRGQLPIVELAGENVNVWNGSEWSKVLVRQTGTNQKLLKINLSNGESLECTYYHHFWLQDTYRSKPRKVEAQDLQPGDKLIKYELPVIESEDDIDFPYAYTSGFFSGDGSYSNKGNHPELDLYGEKRDLLQYIDVRNKLWSNGTTLYEKSDLAVYEDVKQERVVCKLPLDIKPKFTVPLNGYTVNSRLEWLAGLLDADGSVYRNGDNESLSIASINKEFLLKTRLMLQTLGIDSKVGLMNPKGYRKLPDGKGNLRDYYCQTTYRLTINSNGLYQLSQLGLQTNRLNWKTRLPQRQATQFIKVESIEITGRIDDTYCFTEPKRHLGMFNGILTGQCCESFSNVKPGVEAHSCNLVSLNLANVEESELPAICTIAVRILDNTIDITTPPFAASKAHNDKYRTIGVGAMGLADWLAKRHLTYKDTAKISYLFEDMGYWCTHASMELAKERGAYTAFPGSEWSQGKLIGAKPVEWFLENAVEKDRWEKLSQDIQQHGIRNSHITAIAPNTSSSLVQGCTASILPVYSKFFYDKWAKGTVPIAPPFIKDDFWFYHENKTLDQKIVIEAVATIQQWIDTGISMELLFNLNKGVYFPNEPERSLKAKDIYETLMMAWKEGCKAIYYIRTVQKDDFKESSDSCVACAN
ncbi:MAG: ATP cone domain-containing protein [Xenococcaceae cyanobacterium MO_188.B19]|nr:ATP cone domain-containing protein [Xenococcaceae cyanobacterium MO_188.B19]